MKKIAVMMVEVPDDYSFDNILREVIRSKDRLKQYTLEKEILPEETTWQKKLTKILTSLGITRALVGYDILFDIMRELEPDLERKVKLGAIYEIVGKHISKSHSAVERSIRCLIQRIWKLNTTEHISEVFNNFNVTEKPLQNAAFIAIIKQQIFY